MKQSILLIIVCFGLINGKPLSPFQVYQGFVLGFFQEGGLEIEKIQGCTTSISGAVRDITQSVEQLIRYKDTEEALKLLEYALELLQSSIKICYESEQTMQKLSQAIQDVQDLLLEDPKAFAIHIAQDMFINQKDLIHEVADIKKNFADRNSQALGQSLGKATYQVLIGVKV